MRKKKNNTTIIIIIIIIIPMSKVHVHMCIKLNHTFKYKQDTSSNVKPETSLQNNLYYANNYINYHTHSYTFPPTYLWIDSSYMQQLEIWIEYLTKKKAHCNWKRNSLQMVNLSSHTRFCLYQAIHFPIKLSTSYSNLDPCTTVKYST
jgi:hypothetical protein